MSEIQPVNLVNFVNLLLLPCICFVRETKNMPYPGGKLTKLTKLTSGIWHFSAEKPSKRGVRGECGPENQQILFKNRELTELLLTTWGSRRIFVKREGRKNGRDVNLVNLLFSKLTWSDSLTFRLEGIWKLI